MIVAKNGNGRLREKLYVLALVASLLFITIDKIVMPSVNSGKLADAVYAQGKQIAVLEDVVVSLRPLPTEVAGLKASMEGVKNTVDRLEKKMDDRNRGGK